MLGLIISLIVAGVAGWLAGNIMKAQPLAVGGSPIIGNVLLGHHRRVRRRARCCG